MKALNASPTTRRRLARCGRSLQAQQQRHEQDEEQRLVELRRVAGYAVAEVHRPGQGRGQPEGVVVEPGQEAAEAPHGHPDREGDGEEVARRRAHAEPTLDRLDGDQPAGQRPGDALPRHQERHVAGGRLPGGRARGRRASTPACSPRQPRARRRPPPSPGCAPPGGRPGAGAGAGRAGSRSGKPGSPAAGASGRSTGPARRWTGNRRAASMAAGWSITELAARRARSTERNRAPGALSSLAHPPGRRGRTGQMGGSPLPPEAGRAYSRATMPPHPIQSPARRRQRANPPRPGLRCSTLTSWGS